MKQKSASHPLQAAAPASVEKPSWREVFAALDAAQIPHDFLADRDQGAPQVREDMMDLLEGGSREIDQPLTAKVFMSGRSQAVRIPAAYRFKRSEVYIRRDPQTGDLILSEKPSWDEIFAALDAAQFPDDFLSDRNLGIAAKREEL